MAIAILLEAGKRKSFTKIPEIMEMPDLIEIQRKFFEEFFQKNVPPGERKNQGLQEVFHSVFPITDFTETSSLEFVEYSLGNPKYDVDECLERDLTYAVPLKVTLRLVIREEDKETGVKKVKSVKEQEVYLGEIPIMTEKGTFIINGAERVIVSQLHRSPGISFEGNKGAGSLPTARIIPYRGSWLEFEFDSNENLYARIDRRRRILATILLRALGYSTSHTILSLFYPHREAKLDETLIGAVAASEILDSQTGEIILRCGARINEEDIAHLKEAGISKLTVVNFKDEKPDLSVCNTLEKDYTHSTDEALIEIYRKFRPGDPPTIEGAQLLLHNMFFNSRRYDLGKVGRYRLTKKLGLKISPEQTTLTREDIVATLQRLIEIKEGKESVDDIDHLGNRRIRSVGELLQNQFRVGLARMERAVKERMNIQDLENCMPHDLINAKPIIAAVREFFGSSQLSQFMDQTNPLAELAHKRRLSALGPGGLNRKRAGYEVRDVHHSHYGRMCPIETPEGPNIGLISSLSTYARVNEYGFLETPYRQVKNGYITNEIDYLTADEEDELVIAQANASVDEDGRLKGPLVLARYRGNFPLVKPEEIDYMDVSPKQLVSVATALIPFLEHDDANRALMGSNMQRQAVPLLWTEPPLVGTGIEYKVARDSGAAVVAKRDGVVEYVSADLILTRTTDGEIDTYRLIKFRRSNQNTCINQKPIVTKGQKVKAGEIIADGPAISGGELALGHNILVAFIPWRGYNFQDAILVSERLIHEDRYTSIHIEEFEIEARDTKLGREEITRDIPNISEEALKDLDEEGIVRIGAEVKSGDILVGKVTPKGETELTPEERLLRAIFGEKAGDVRDASLKVPPGIEGRVIDVKVFSRREKDEKLSTNEMEFVKRLEKEKKVIIRRIEEASEKDIRAVEEKYSAKNIGSGGVRKKAQLEKETKKQIDRIKTLAGQQIAQITKEKEKQINKIKHGDELPPGVNKMVKVYVAMKRKLQVGDKMAGRHGNKGVIARILPVEDMPYLNDGTPVDIVLNPLGVPSRMNVGQILETHLGWAAKILGMQVASPVFDGATEAEIWEMLKMASLPPNGKAILRDGPTGKIFDQEVTVGYIYMMKLIHLVDDKIHARSIGPYSLITQQPLGGKAQFGGQRFGEMEVWALEAYGAAHILQELLTVKSDDVAGRTRVYEAIVKGEDTGEPGIPESFNVLIKELQSLALDIDLLDGNRRESKLEKQR